MLSKEEYLAMSLEQVYEAMLNGKLSVEQFREWIEEDFHRHREEGYNLGYKDGHRAATEWAIALMVLEK